MPFVNSLTLDDGICKRGVQLIQKRWRHISSKYVIAKQDQIKFGENNTTTIDKDLLDEQKADAAVFRKSDVGDAQVQWH